MNKLGWQGVSFLICLGLSAYFWVTHQPVPESLGYLTGGFAGVFIKEKAEQAITARIMRSMK